MAWRGGATEFEGRHLGGGKDREKARVEGEEEGKFLGQVVVACVCTSLFPVFVNELKKGEDGKRHYLLYRIATLHPSIFSLFRSTHSAASHLLLLPALYFYFCLYLCENCIGAEIFLRPGTPHMYVRAKCPCLHRYLSHPDKCVFTPTPPNYLSFVYFTLLVVLDTIIPRSRGFIFIMGLGEGAVG